MTMQHVLETNLIIQQLVALGCQSMADEVAKQLEEMVMEDNPDTAIRI